MNTDRKPISEEGYYVLAKYKDGEYVGLHHDKGMLVVYAHISNARRAKTRLTNMSGGETVHKIVKLSVTIDDTTIAE